MSKVINIGLAGFGTVGSGVAEILAEQQSMISAKIQQPFELNIVKILVRDTAKALKHPLVNESQLTTNWEDLIHDDSIDWVIELIGGTTHAYTLVKAALEAKKPVITGNKALISEHGAELFALSKTHQTPIYFEAAVAGGIPIITNLRQTLSCNEIKSITGIINGTCNYILEQMSVAKISYEQALKQAQDLGYAEADPTLDVNGWDATHKALIISCLTYGFYVDPKLVHVEGIDTIQATDLVLAETLGYSLKLISKIKKQDNGAIEIRTQPSLIPKSSILSSVNGVFNALLVDGNYLGDSFFYGQGAGKFPTASSVVTDLITCYQDQATGEFRGFLPFVKSGEIVKPDLTKSAYYVRLNVIDRAGVMAKVTQSLANSDISLSGTHSPIDPSNPDAEFTTMVLLVHTCEYGKLKSALSTLQTEVKEVTQAPVVLRIEDV